MQIESGFCACLKEWKEKKRQSRRQNHVYAECNWMTIECICSRHNIAQHKKRAETHRYIYIYIHNKSPYNAYDLVSYFCCFYVFSVWYILYMFGRIWFFFRHIHSHSYSNSSVCFGMYCTYVVALLLPSPIVSVQT